jgi:hypothetical protein
VAGYGKFFLIFGDEPLDKTSMICIMEETVGESQPGTTKPLFRSIIGDIQRIVGKVAKIFSRSIGVYMCGTYSRK